MKSRLNLLSILSSLGVIFLAASQASAGAAPKVTPELVAEGKKLYETNCLSCHGEKGDGKGPAGTYLTPPPRHFVKDKFKNKDTVDGIMKTLNEGLKNTSMVSFGHLPEKERYALTYYVRFLGGKEKTAPAK